MPEPLSKSPSPQTINALRDVRERFPQTPFLTLGQTVLWDEPVKAAFCRLCETLEATGEIPSGARMVAGVHDTDYFAKLEGLAVKDQPFVVLRHNDGDTRGLWSAAGELSALFGAEVVPSRSDFTREGISFHKAARAYFGGAESLLNQETDAPGWRALVHTEPHPLIAADVKLVDILPALRQQLRWGFRQSLSATGCAPDFENDEPCQARDVARTVLRWVDEFAVLNESATLSDLYRDLIPKIWSLVRGGDDCGLETTSSMELFRFNAQTANRPRFRFVDIFLNPATRRLARRCYDDAVRGSGIYTLDQFGDGALPFDVVVPGHGRGTLRLSEGKIIIETEPPIEICQNCDPESVARLAALLEGHFGPDIALVGKAVSLISMLAAEFLFVFHQKASGYTTRTQKMNDSLRAAGIELELHPMLRLKYATWDALAGVDASFKLPPHLSAAFGTDKIDAPDFAQRWREVADRADESRKTLSGARNVRELMLILAQKNPLWREREIEYENARIELRATRTEAEKLRAEREHERKSARLSSTKAGELERAKSAYFRAEILPLQRRISDIKEAAAKRVPVGKISKSERAELSIQSESDTREIESLRARIDELVPQWRGFVDEIEACRIKARTHRTRALEARTRQLKIEKGEIARNARARLERLECEAELERLLCARDAMWASGSLHGADYRPTAWWLPMVSPDGKWFDALAQGAQVSVEEL